MTIIWYIIVKNQLCYIVGSDLVNEEVIFDTAHLSITVLFHDLQISSYEVNSQKFTFKYIILIKRLRNKS